MWSCLVESGVWGSVEGGGFWLCGSLVVCDDAVGCGGEW